MARDGRHSLIVGIDYGTTFSGMSYVASTSRRDEDITVVEQWPKEGHLVSKAPTIIAYASENQDMGDDKWGYAVPPGATCCSWTKLLLDEEAWSIDHEGPQLGGASRMDMLRLPPLKSAHEVCVDYLRCLYNYLLELLRETSWHKIESVTPFEFWITVPAMWSDRVRDRMKQAAKTAGFGSRTSDSVNIITEPEAAALSVLKPSLTAQDINPLKPGDVVMICDCGGGTVEITSLQFQAYEPKLMFRELCIGNGGMCGSTYIDKNFIEWMTDTFGNAYTSLGSGSRGSGSRLMSSFETEKRTFGSDESDDPEIILECPDMKAPKSSRFDPDWGQVKLPR